MPNDAKTFATLTTPPGRGGIAVIALAGSGAAEIVRRIFRPWKSHQEDRPGALRLGHIVDGGRILDEVVLCRVSGAAPADFYEINIHGGPLVARETMDLLERAGAEINRDGPYLCCHTARQKGDSPHFACPVFSPAHPRWNNPAIGREMLAALPQAHSELVVTALTQQWSAGISKLASDLLSCHPPSAIRHPQLSLRQASDSLPTFKKLLHPCEVVVLGPPNAGKSTLVNALVGRQVSIVHEQPGTTRDWVRELALIRGVPVYLTDTAGLWEESSEIDAQAMRRARAAAAAADLVLLTGAGEEIGPGSWLGGKSVLRLATKCDAYAPGGKFDVAVSAHTDQGMEELKTAILRTLGLADIDPTAPMAFTERQGQLLLQAAEHPNKADGLMRQLLE